MPTSGHALLVDNTVGGLIDGILPLATLIVPKKSEAELIHSHRQEVLIPSLAVFVSTSRGLLTFGSKAVLQKGGDPMKTVTGVRELLTTNPTSSVHKHGLPDEDANILRVGHTEEDQVSQLVIDVLRDSCGSGGAEETQIFIRLRIESPSTHGTG